MSFDLARYCARIGTDPATGERVRERRIDDDWFALFGFDDQAPWPVDIAAANVVCTRWEQSPFPGNLMVTRLAAARLPPTPAAA